MANNSSNANNSDRQPYFVTIATSSDEGSPVIRYGFVSDLLASVRSALGITPSGSTAGVIYGINSPKPVRMGKKINGFSRSSFCSDANIASAKEAGFRIVKPRKSRGFVATAKTVPLGVPMTIGGQSLIYAYRCKQSLKALALSAGAQEFTTDTDKKKAIWGSRNVKPAKGTFADANGKSQTVFGVESTMNGLSPAPTSVVKAKEGD